MARRRATDFTFIDLFAGIGGIRLAFERTGGQCVFSSEYDPHSQKTYAAYFGERPDFAGILEVDPKGDITKLPPRLVPSHDILTGGFPCQPFSLAGVSKKNSLGKPHGFDDPTQGTLFFNIKEILASKRPKAFLLENVKHLVRHDGGRTYAVIMSTLRELGYDVFDRVIDAAGWVPQHRERIFIVGFRKSGRGQSWGISDFPELYRIKPPKDPASLSDVLEDDVPAKYTLGPGTWATLRRHKAYHQAKGQGFGYGLLQPPFNGQATRTLSARYHKDGAEILLSQGPRRRPRRLTPLECARLMGFPHDFQDMFDRCNLLPQPVSDTQAYRQFGNAVAVPLVTAVARAMVRRLRAAGALSASATGASRGRVARAAAGSGAAKVL